MFLFYPPDNPAQFATLQGEPDDPPGDARAVKIALRQPETVSLESGSQLQRALPHRRHRHMHQRCPAIRIHFPGWQNSARLLKRQHRVGGDLSVSAVNLRRRQA